MTLLHPVSWLVGILGYLLIVGGAARLRELAQPGFDKVQCFASLCILCRLVSMPLTGIPAAVLTHFAWAVLAVLLTYAVWQAFGRMCAEGNRIGRAALCAQILCAALHIVQLLLYINILDGFQPIIRQMTGWMARGFELLAALLLAVFLLVKQRTSKEDKA